MLKKIKKYLNGSRGQDFWSFLNGSTHEYRFNPCTEIDLKGSSDFFFSKKGFVLHLNRPILRYLPLEPYKTVQKFDIVWADKGSRGYCIFYFLKKKKEQEKAGFSIQGILLCTANQKKNPRKKSKAKSRFIFAGCVST